MRKWATGCVATVLAIALFSACGRQEANEPPDLVSVRLKWLHQAQFAGMYVADQRGFYAEENIEVALHEGGLEYDEIEQVALGQDDFAVVEASHVIVARGNDRPVVACAAIYRVYPSVYFSLRGSGIERPQDFVGRRVMVNPVDYILPAMMERLGLDMSQIEAVPPSYDMSAFFAGEVDVWSGYLTAQVVAARERGAEIDVIYPGHYGIHVYGDVIIVSEELIEENPDLVERFLRATLRGWRYAIENPDQAAAMTLEYDPTLDLSRETASMAAQIPLIHTGEDQIGWMRDEIWQEIHQLLLDSGRLARPVDVDEVYAMAFLHSVYGGGK
jgi:NitT/TauT family transport system substrate-binding protein